MFTGLLRTIIARVRWLVNPEFLSGASRRLDPAPGDADNVSPASRGNAMQVKWHIYAGAVAVIGLLASGVAAQAQQKTEIAVSRQPGILYMPTHIIEKQKLIEKHAARLGLSGVTTRWVTLSGGGAQTDALLAGGVDILWTGTGNVLLLWDRTKGGVKGIVAPSAQPMSLISRDERIKTIKDLARATRSRCRR